MCRFSPDRVLNGKSSTGLKLYIRKIPFWTNQGYLMFDYRNEMLKNIQWQSRGVLLIWAGKKQINWNMGISNEVGVEWDRLSIPRRLHQIDFVFPIIMPCENVASQHKAPGNWNYWLVMLANLWRETQNQFGGAYCWFVTGRSLGLELDNTNSIHIHLCKILDLLAQPFQPPTELKMIKHECLPDVKPLHFMPIKLHRLINRLICHAHVLMPVLWFPHRIDVHHACKWLPN